MVTTFFSGFYKEIVPPIKFFCLHGDLDGIKQCSDF